MNKKTMKGIVRTLTGLTLMVITVVTFSCVDVKQQPEKVFETKETLIPGDWYVVQAADSLYYTVTSSSTTKIFGEKNINTAIRQANDLNKPKPNKNTVRVFKASATTDTMVLPQD